MLDSYLTSLHHNSGIDLKEKELKSLLENLLANKKEVRPNSRRGTESRGNGLIVDYQSK